jgi:GntR family transcriptional regulator/MocR family aminotransferase
VLVEEIERRLGRSCTIVGDDAGMHLTLLIHGAIRDTHIVDQAAQRKLVVSALSGAYLGDAPRQGLVLGFGNTRARDIPAAVRTLARLLDA